MDREMKVILLLAFICIVGLGITIPQCSKRVREEGLKTQFEQLWYGEKGMPQKK